MKAIKFTLSNRSHTGFFVSFLSTQKFIDSKIIVTNAFMKKQQKLPEAEKNRALKCKQDYENRIKKGAYYEKES